MKAIKADVLSYLVLMSLLALTIIFAYVDLGEFNLTVALVIAAAKAVIIALFFMELIRSNKLITLFVVSIVIWLVIFGILTFSDYMTRPWPANSFMETRPYYPMPAQ